MEHLIKEIVTVYGPLGIGWIAAAWLLRQNMLLQDKVMTAFISDTQAKAEMKSALDALTRAVKG